MDLGFGGRSGVNWVAISLRLGNKNDDSNRSNTVYRYTERRGNS